MDRDADGYPPVEVESMWANPRAGGYELESIPFYAKGVALGDVVSAEVDRAGALVYTKVLERGAHSAYRVYLLDPAPDDPQRTISFLRGHGLRVEYDVPRLLAIDIPPSISLDFAESLL